MPGYGVPEDDDGVLPWSWAQARLVASRNYWVVTVSGDGRPHAMPVWGVWLAERERFAFSCSPGSRKARNLAVNPRVVVAGEDTVECVSVEGTAAPCAGALLGEAASAFGAKYESEPHAQEGLARFFREHASFAVAPERAFGIIERADEFSTRATRWTW